MPRPKIVTCFPLAESHVEQITDVVNGQFDILVSQQETIADDIFLADVFCGHAKVQMDWEKVVQQGRLKWIQSSAAGLDHCLHPAVIDSEILVSGCSALFANQVAEQSMALLMGLIRRMPVFFRAQQIKEYVRRPTDNLFGKTIGIVGMGGNGQRIARTLRPMCQSIYGVDFFPEACNDIINANVVNAVFGDSQLPELLGMSDVVIVTLPLTGQTKGLISDYEFKLMTPGTYIVNVGRGSVVDTASLIKYLANGKLAGAGIDVVDPEPLPPDSPLWEMDNVIISPHVGAQSPDRVPRTVNLFCQNLIRFAKGESLANLVDKDLGFPRPQHRIPFD